jgi:hypothetical protein
MPKGSFVIFDLEDAQPRAGTLTLVDSNCSPILGTFELLEYSKVRCAGRVRQRGDCVSLQMRALQVIDPRPDYASFLGPILGGYVLLAQS